MALQTKTITANGSKGHHKFTLTVVEELTSTANNYSIVKWSFTIAPIKTGYDWSYSNTVPVSYTVSINGKSYSGSIMAYDGKSTATITSGEEVISHNADGKKSIPYSFSITSLNQSYLTGNASNSGNMDLTFIPREAQLVDADSFFDEANPNIYYTNPAGSAVDKLQACISVTGAADIAYRDIPKDKDSYTFELTEAERNILRSYTLNGHDTITVYFHVKTTIGGVDYTNYLARYMTVVNATPTLSPVVEDVDSTTLALTGSKDVLIRGYSDVKMLVNAQAYKGASIIYQKIEIDGKSTTNNIVNANEPITYPNIENPAITFTAKDNRGLIVTKTITKTAIDYIKLTCNLEAQAPTTDGVLNFTISGNYFGGSFGAQSNTLTVQYRYLTNSGSYGSWVTIAATAANGTYKATGSISGLDYKNSYTIQARALDKLNTIASAEIKVKTTPIFDWGENDFNFNVPVSINGTELAYITEEGTKNGWYYRNWSNGKGECWKILKISTKISAAWGSMYRGDTIMERQNYPFPFKSKPVEQATIQSGGNAGWLYAESNGLGVNGAYASAVYNICRPSAVTTALDVYISIYAYGEL